MLLHIIVEILHVIAYAMSFVSSVFASVTWGVGGVGRGTLSKCKSNATVLKITFFLV